MSKKFKYKQFHKKGWIWRMMAIITINLFLHLNHVFSQLYQGRCYPYYASPIKAFFSLKKTLNCILLCRNIYLSNNKIFCNTWEFDVFHDLYRMSIYSSSEWTSTKVRIFLLQFKQAEYILLAMLDGRVLLNWQQRVRSTSRESICCCFSLLMLHTKTGLPVCCILVNQLQRNDEKEPWVDLEPHLNLIQINLACSSSSSSSSADGDNGGDDGWFFLVYPSSPYSDQFFSIYTIQSFIKPSFFSLFFFYFFRSHSNS